MLRNALETVWERLEKPLRKGLGTGLETVWGRQKRSGEARTVWERPDIASGLEGSAPGPEVQRLVLRV